MNHGVRMRLGASLAVATAVLGASLVGGAVVTTQAAWTDVVAVAAPVTAGGWEEGDARGTCEIVDQSGQPVECSIRSMTYEEWSSAQGHVRAYHIFFDFDPARPPEWVTFRLDLSAATGDGTDDWNWDGAGISTTNSQFTPDPGWTCGDLPILAGRAQHWFTDVYVQVVEGQAGAPGMCGN